MGAFSSRWAGLVTKCTFFTKMSQLSSQRRMAMSIFNVGFRKVWLDPTKSKVIAEAKSRAQIRDLIGKDIIQVIPSYRGKRDKLTPILQANNKTLQRIKREFAAKQIQVREASGDQVTSLSGESIEEASTQAL